MNSERFYAEGRGTTDACEPRRKFLTRFAGVCDGSGSEFNYLQRIASCNFRRAMATTICVMNQKGGCGKSSTCFHLAGAFAEIGLDVLLLDMDPQGSLSQGFLGAEAVESLELQNTVATLFDERTFFDSRDTLVIPTHVERIGICPANHLLAPFNTREPESIGLVQFAVRDFIAERFDEDVVIIDCPPNLYACTWTAVLATDYLLIPIPPEDFGTHGLRAVHQCVEEARRLNPSLRRLGHLVTRCDSRLLVHRMYEQKLRAMYREMVMNTVIPEASAFKVSVTRRQPVQTPRSIIEGSKIDTFSGS